MPGMRPTSRVHSQHRTLQFGVYTHLDTSIIADRDHLHITTTLDGHHLHTESVPRQHANFPKILQRADQHLTAFEQLIQRVQGRLDKPDLNQYDSVILTQRVTSHLAPLDIPPITAANLMNLLNRPFRMNDHRLPATTTRTDLTFSLDMPAEGQATLTLTGNLFPQAHITEQLIWESLIPDMQRLRKISINGINSLNIAFPGQHDVIRTHVERELHRARTYVKHAYTHQLTSDRDPASLRAAYDALVNRAPTPPDLTDALALTQATLNLYR